MVKKVGLIGLAVFLTIGMSFSASATSIPMQRRLKQNY